MWIWDDHWIIYDDIEKKGEFLGESSLGHIQT